MIPNSCIDNLDVTLLLDLPGMNDGSAAVLLMSGAEAGRRGVSAMARVVAWGQAGVDPAIMGTGPIPAVRLAVSWFLPVCL